MSRSIINLNLTGIPSNATVFNAQLKLRSYEAYNNTSSTWVNRWIQAHQLLLGWDEAKADSLERSTSVNWAAPRGKIGGTNPDANGQYESTLLIVEDEVLPVWKSWDLTALTQKWVSGSTANYGVLLWATNENTSGYVLRFYSSEAMPDSVRPKLEIIWSNTPQTVYFLKDHLGSIRAAVSDSGKAATVIGYDDYDAWGYPLALRTKAIPNAYLQGASKNKFTGKERDDDLGVNLDYFGARYYDPQIGRWSVRDPLSEKYPSHSPYHYVLNNPARLIDLNGAETYVDSSGNVISNMTIWDSDDPSVFLVMGNGGMMLLGELGGKIYADIILKNLLEMNIEYAEEIWNPFTFKDLARTGGGWDYKNNAKTIFGLGNTQSGTTFIFNSNTMESQDFGNFHFGAVGEATGLFPEWFMLYMAGRVQIAEGTSKPEWQKGRFTPPYGDDPKDQGWITKGVQYYQDNKKRGSK